MNIKAIVLKIFISSVAASVASIISILLCVAKRAFHVTHKTIPSEGFNFWVFVNNL